MIKKLLPTSLKLAAVGIALGAFAVPAGAAPYFENFDVAPGSTTLPVGWDFNLDQRNGYEDYSFGASTTNGVDGTRCLQFKTQLLEEDWYDWDFAPKRAPQTNLSGYRTAAFFTPIVSGTVTMKIRSYGTTPTYTDEEFFNIYDVTTTASGILKPNINSMLDYTEVELEGYGAPEGNPWRLVTLDVGETPKRIALVPSNLYLDDFSAEFGEIPVIRKLKISDFGTQGPSKLYANEQGEVIMPVKFKLENQGNVALNPGDENYTVTMLKNSTAFYTWQADSVLEVGESKVFFANLPFTLPDPTQNQLSQSVRGTENISGTGSYATTFSIYGWNSSCIFYEPDRDSSLPANNSLGLFSGSKEFSFRIFNQGGAPLVISDMEAPGYVTADVEFPLTVEGGTSQPVVLTFASDPGAIDCSVIFNGNGTGSDNKTTLKFTGAVIEEGIYVASFDDKEIPGTWIAEMPAEWKVYTSTSIGGSALQTPSAAGKGKMITDKIAFAEGQKMTISYAGTSFYGSPYPNLKVYVSPDRSNWTEVADFVHLDSERTHYIPTANMFKAAEIEMPEGEWYIGFEGVKTYIDYIFGGTQAVVLHDLFLSDYTTPANAMVNHAVNVSMKLKNYGSETEEASTYTVSLLHGGVTVATAESQDLESGAAPTTFNCSFIPHYACEERPLKMVVEFEDGYTVETAEEMLAIAEEVLVAEQYVGEATTSNKSEYVPFKGYDKNSRSLMTYTPEMIPLQSGAKISKIAFLFANTSSKSPYDREIKMWMSNGNDKTAYADSVSMTPIVHVLQQYALTTAEEKTVLGAYDVMEFTLPEVFEYDGTGFQIMARSEAGVWGKTEFATFDATDAAIYNSNDTYSSYKSGSPSNVSKLPVLILGLEAEPLTVNGTVTHTLVGAEPEAIAGAIVRFEGDGLLYSATTDENGLYSLPIYQNGHAYVTSVYACGHVDNVSEAAVYDENAEVNVDMAENMVNAETFLNSVGAGNTVELTWEAIVPGTLDVEKDIAYEIYVDGVKVGETGETAYTVDLAALPAAVALDDESDATEYVLGIKARIDEYLTQAVNATVSMTVGVADVAINGIRVSVENAGVAVSAPAGAMIQVVDAAGAAVKAVADGEVTMIPVQPGVYFVVVSDGTNRIVKKVIVG